MRRNSGRKFSTNSSDNLRERLASAVSGGNDNADTMHNIYLDFGYPDVLSFSEFWNMYRRFGIAKNGCDLPVDTSWMSEPKIIGSDKFNNELQELIDSKSLFQRLAGLDKRQRVGRYAGLFMRVRDSLPLSAPIGDLNGIGSLIEMIPLYEGQLEVLETESDATQENFDKPTMYLYKTSGSGNRNEKSQSSFSIHPSRLIMAAEGADDGGIYGIPAQEACYNSLMDARKIIGAGGEGFYKNASQNVVFNLDDTSSASQNASLLNDFNENYDDFAANRMRRAMWTPGLTPTTLESSLANPKEFFDIALNDCAAAFKLPATILIGQQTGRLASNEDSRSYLSTINSRRNGYITELVGKTISWLIENNILIYSEYTVEWDDLLALSDDEKLDTAGKMSVINRDQFLSGSSTTFTEDEIREQSGYEPLLDIDVDTSEGGILADGEENEG